MEDKTGTEPPAFADGWSKAMETRKKAIISRTILIVMKYYSHRYLRMVRLQTKTLGGSFDEASAYV
jgi:hypothetical protein